MLAGELIFYNRFTNKAVHRVDMEDLDIEEYQNSSLFYKIISELRIGRVTTSIHYTNGAPKETTIYERDVSHPMILHIPHSSTFIPERYNAGWIGDPIEAVRVLTDHFTDELFDYPTAHRVVSPISRIVCDVERFETGEEMEERFGMGIVYECDHQQNLLRAVSEDFKKEIVENYYRPHHRALYEAVTEELSAREEAIIVDCHSFNFESLPHVADQMRPDFCIGTDSFHTPLDLVIQLVDFLSEGGYRVAVNEPFAGTIVPLEYYHSNSAVISVMIEVNKRLYLDEKTCKNSNFDAIKTVITELLKIVNNYKT